MQRAAVVGPGGAGKSTFATELGRLAGLPVIHLDRHYWKPGWVPTPPDQWRQLQERLLAGDRWVVDGNYGSTLDVRFQHADTVIVLEPPRLVCLSGALRRNLANRGRAVQASGCPERVDLAFMRWIWRYPTDSRPRVDAALERHAERLDVVRLPSRRAAAAFLRHLAAGEP